MKDTRGLRVAKADAQDQKVAEVAAALSKLVLSPVAARLKQKRLLIVSEGALQYVPFAALPDPASQRARPLVLEHEIVSLPSASTLAVLRHELSGRKPAPKSLAVLADPVFDSRDERTKLPKAEKKEGEQTATSAEQPGWAN